MKSYMYNMTMVMTLVQLHSRWHSCDNTCIWRWRWHSCDDTRVQLNRHKATWSASNSMYMYNYQCICNYHISSNWDRGFYFFTPHWAAASTRERFYRPTEAIIYARAYIGGARRKNFRKYCPPFYTAKLLYRTVQSIAATAKRTPVDSFLFSK